MTQRQGIDAGFGPVAALGPMFALLALCTCQPAPLDAIGLAPTSLGNGLIAHYTFDEGVGTAVHDHSGNNRDGVLMSGTWIAVGKFGGALHFDGTSSVVVPQFPNATTSLSVSAWIRTALVPPLDGGAIDLAAFQTVLSTEVPNKGGWQINLGLAPLRVHTGFYDPTRPPSGGYTTDNCVCVVANRWMHVASVFDGSMLALYVDGALITPVPAPNPILVGTIQLFMGRWNDSGRYLVGDLDDVAIYNRALAAEEVRELLLSPPPDPP